MNSIQEAVQKITENAKTDEQKIERIFYFVRDETLFGFIGKYLRASPEDILTKGLGVCFNKAELLVAMVREAGISARLRHSWVHPNCLPDLIHPFHLSRLPDPFLHIYLELMLQGKWVPMDVISDNKLHKALIKKKLNFARYPENRDFPTSSPLSAS